MRLLLCTALLWSCQNEQPPAEAPPTLFAELFVRYIAPQGSLKATATFLKGDSLGTAEPIELKQPALFQGQPMDARYLPNNYVRYSTEKRIPFKEAYTFSFEENGAEAQEVALALDPIDSFSIVGATASLSDGMQLVIPGERLEEGESIVLLFSNAQNQATTITLTNPAARDTFNIAPIRLRKLKPGPHRIYLVKKQHRIHDFDGGTAQADIEYYTREQPFTVVE